MQKLSTLKPGDRFVWRDSRYQVTVIPKKKKKGIVVCVTVPEFDQYLNFDAEMIIKPIIRVNLN